MPPSPLPPESDAAITPADIRDGAAVALTVGVAGVLLGMLWAWLAPRVQYVSNGEAVFLRNTESEARIGSDGTFLLLSAGLGVLSAVLVFLWRRRGGVPLVIGLVVGSCFASLVGWRLGLWLGPTSDLVEAAKRAGKGVPFDAPLELLAHGVLLGWPMVAVVVHLGLTALWGPRDPEPLPEWHDAVYPPVHVHAPGADAAPEPPRGAAS
ncbi:DUF2567 domain-containing protein [Streptomyces sp. NPDC051183]|uniref:DUF2567 domain-containing protein n=1 Tax=Streptomyces sp. NPDC051183 TaxID=3155165 RepID=UPI0034221FC6